MDSAMKRNRSRAFSASRSASSRSRSAVLRLLSRDWMPASISLNRSTSTPSSSPESFLRANAVVAGFRYRSGGARPAARSGSRSPRAASTRAGRRSGWKPAGRRGRWRHRAACARRFRRDRRAAPGFRSGGRSRRIACETVRSAAAESKFILSSGRRASGRLRPGASIVASMVPSGR